MKPKVLPIIYVIIFAVCMYLIASMIDLLKIELHNRGLISVAISIFGVFIIWLGGYQFKKASTTFNPLAPEEATQLVTSGIYRYSRNPMYIGFLLLLLAWAIFLGSLFALLVLPVFVLLISIVQIRPEEKALEDKFGDAYRHYLSSVRRWI